MTHIDATFSLEVFCCGDDCKPMLAQYGEADFRIYTESGHGIVSKISLLAPTEGGIVREIDIPRDTRRSDLVSLSDIAWRNAYAPEISDRLISTYNAQNGIAASDPNAEHRHLQRELV